MAFPKASTPSMIETLDGYMEAFNDNDLDRVMTFFADDAVCCPGSRHDLAHMKPMNLA